MTRLSKSILALAVATTTTLGLASCGPGRRGSGSPGGGSALIMVGIPAVGRTDGINALLTVFNIITPTPATRVGPTNVPAANAGDTDYVEIAFNKGVLANSITSSTPSGNDAVEVRDSQGALVPYFFDSAGAIDPSNAFSAPGVTPPVVRLYFQDPTSAPGVPTALPNEQYTLHLSPENLVAGDGNAFCLVRSSGCSNPTEIVYSFTVGGDVQPVAPAANPSAPLVNAVVPIDQEFRFFFNEAVDFQSVVGTNNANRSNVTDLDPFCSIPFPVNNIITIPGMPPTFITTNLENVTVLFTPPAGAVIPPNYNFIFYMPDPFHNPTEVRLRFVDANFVTPFDSLGNTQNYGIDADTWESAGLVAPTNNLGNKLRIPPALPLPGSTATSAATLSVTFLSQANALANISSSAGPGGMPVDNVFGVTDRARNPMAADFTVNYTLDQGPQIANNPQPPDLSIISHGHVLGALSSGRITTSSLFNGILTGEVNLLSPTIDDRRILDDIVDVSVGINFLLQGPGNNIFNPGRVGFTTAGGLDPAILPPNATAPTSFWQLCNPPPGPPPSPPFGVRLYVVDGRKKEVAVFDSTTFLPLGNLTGIASPAGLGADPTGQFMYVSNFDQNTMQRIGVNASTTALFHQVTATITVGTNPTAVSVDTGNEDVFCINSGENSISKVDIPSVSEVETFPVGAGATDLMFLPRMLCMGCTLAYHGYITNKLDNSVSVYESDSVSIQVSNGPEGKIIDKRGGFSGPSFGVPNFFAIPSGAAASPGAIIANATGTTSDHFVMINFGLNPVPGFMGPPGFRTLQTVQSFSAPLAGSPSDVSFDNMTSIANQCTLTWGGPRVVLATYPTAGAVASIDYMTGAFYSSVQTPAMGIYTYRDQ